MPFSLITQEAPKNHFHPPQPAFPYPSHFFLLVVAPATREKMLAEESKGGRQWSIRGTLATIEKTF